MKYRVVIHQVAEEDIRRNARWWAENHSHAEAEKWFHFAFDSLETLAGFPESHPFAPENETFPFEVREMHFGFGSRPGYRAVFRIRDDEVHVLTVRRAAQDTISPNDLRIDEL